MTNKLIKDDPDAKELTHLDVQFVSAVGNPATGKNFLLYKSQEAKMTDTVTAPNTDVPVNESTWAELGKRIASAFGIKTADQTLTEATEALAEIASKASGRAPSDDAGQGRNPSYPTPPYTKTKGIPNTNTGTPSVGNSAPGTTAKQQPEVVEGTPAVQSSVSDVTEGSPVTKDLITEFLGRIEKSAINPEALAQAKLSLEAAFQPVPEEQHMTSDEVRELVLKALDPVIEAVEKHETEIETMKDADYAALQAKYDALLERVDTLENTYKSVDGNRKVAKSRVPVATEPVAKSSGIWGGSPFEIAADLG